MSTVIESFFDAETGTATHLVADPASGRAAVIDSVLDYEPRSGRTAHHSAQRVLDRVRALGLQVDWLLETHAHADHLSAAPWLQRHWPGARIGIGRHIADVQRVFGGVFNARYRADVFDRLFDDGETFALGGLAVEVLHTPGHTPACVSYRIGDDVFVGDTLFMPDYGSARCDFPGGDAAALYRSARRLLTLPPHTRLHLCHDYPPAGRTAQWISTVAEQRARNVHLHDGVDEASFVALREARDRTLPMPLLMLPAVQVNLQAGHLPEAETNGKRYLRIPIDGL